MAKIQALTCFVLTIFFVQTFAQDDPTKLTTFAATTVTTTEQTTMITTQPTTVSTTTTMSTTTIPRTTTTSKPTTIPTTMLTTTTKPTTMPRTSTTTMASTTTTKPTTTTPRTTITTPTTTMPKTTTTATNPTTMTTTRPPTPNSTQSTTTEDPFHSGEFLESIYFYTADCYECGMTVFGSIMTKVCGSKGCCLTPWDQGSFTPGGAPDVFSGNYTIGECSDFYLKDLYYYDPIAVDKLGVTIFHQGSDALKLDKVEILTRNPWSGETHTYGNGSYFLDTFIDNEEYVHGFLYPYYDLEMNHGPINE